MSNKKTTKTKASVKKAKASVKSRKKHEVGTAADRKVKTPKPKQEAKTGAVQPTTPQAALTTSATLPVPKLSAIEAAVKVLGETGKAMNCQELITTMATKGYWTSPGGKTPASTLYAAILRELKLRGAQARFQKTERGKFILHAAG
jgi:hypothetical protein